MFAEVKMQEIRHVLPSNGYKKGSKFRVMFYRIKLENTIRQLYLKTKNNK